MSREGASINKTLAKSSFFIYAAQAIYVESLVAVIVRKFVPGTGELMMTLKYFLLVGLTVVVLLGVYSLMKIMMPCTTNILMGSRE